MNTTHYLSGIRDFIVGRNISELFIKGFRLWHREGLHGLTRLIRGFGDISYSEWISRYDTLTEHDRLSISRHIAAMTYRPLISVLMPTYNTPEWLLQKAIASVQSQLYPNWELCIADDASHAPHVRTFLEQAAQLDHRIRIVFRQENGHISAASNSALKIAHGDFIALLDHDDELAESALYHVANALNENTDLDLLYSDEDKIDIHGKRFGHYFKPDWNPDLFCSQNMISHLGVYRTSIARAIGGFRTGYEGSQDWDFALRFIAQTQPARIHHIPRILYHWRAIPGSTSVSISAKSYAVEAARRSLTDYWNTRKIHVELEGVEPGHFNARICLPAMPPVVSIIILATDRLDRLRCCMDGLNDETDYAELEILLITSSITSPDIQAHLPNRRQDRNVRVLAYSGPAQHSSIYNWAAEQAQGEVLCLLSDAAAPASPLWLKHLVGHALRPEIGATGAKLCTREGKVVHSGYILNNGEPECPFADQATAAPGYANRALLNQNLSAVSAACMVIRKALWDEVGGMDDQLFPAVSGDIDFCLSLIGKGYQNLWVPLALLYYSGEQPRLRGENELARQSTLLALRKKWGERLNHDPAWNPNLAIRHGSIGLNNPTCLATRQGQDR
ncbi:glycosyltransferase family 2 protein [Dechloromonas sp. A34]|uniref:glycosyltransferase family 2 protein n=1 Tax=Dechloromonas sp. A34 TaxID=447588 RepID=UPI002249632B|nr:glycosyltransferase [Dechloromonas sp. A34]